MKNTSRKIWEQPWGYAEGFMIAAGILLSGYLLQLKIGYIEPLLFASPVNLIIGLLFTALLITVFFLLSANRVVRWLSGVYAAVPALTVLLLLSVILGSIPQHPQIGGTGQMNNDLLTRLGWYQMTSSWPFVLLCLYVLMIVGLTTLKKVHQKKSTRDIGFYLNHLGIYIALLGGLLGSADMERLTMNVQEGKMEWRGNSLTGEIKELSLAIQLDTFMIEEYPPKLVIIENETGRMLPASRPESYQFEEVGKKSVLAGVSLEITDYLPHAAIFRDSTFMNVVPMMMKGATTAIRVKASTSHSEQPVEGWITNGSYLFPPRTLRIDETISIAMPPGEIKKYSSYVTLYTEKGTTRQSVIEVNKPLSLEEWMIYQYSYDDSMGKYADTSVFELVKDPWLKVVYTGIFMLMAGAIFLFITGPKMKRAAGDKNVMSGNETTSTNDSNSRSGMTERQSENI